MCFLLRFRRFEAGAAPGRPGARQEEASVGPSRLGLLTLAHQAREGGHCDPGVEHAALVVEVVTPPPNRDPRVKMSSVPLPVPPPSTTEEEIEDDMGERFAYAPI